MAVNEQNYKGKLCRYYREGYVWVSEDGSVVAYNEKKYNRWGIKVTKTKYPRKKTNLKGNVYVETRFGHTVSVAMAVLACWGAPCPDDGKRHMINHKDGNLQNNAAKNLEWVDYHYKHTTSPSTSIRYKNLVVDVSSDGSFEVDSKPVSITDCWYDSDVDCLWCSGPVAVLNTKDSYVNGERVNPDDLMKNAGYIQGDDAGLNDPVILHKDYDWANFKSENLEFCESDDPRYQQYLQAIKDKKRERIIELNPGKQVPKEWL